MLLGIELREFRFDHTLGDVDQILPACLESEQEGRVSLFLLDLLPLEMVRVVEQLAHLVVQSVGFLLQLRHVRLVDVFRDEFVGGIQEDNVTILITLGPWVSVIELAFPALVQPLQCLGLVPFHGVPMVIGASVPSTLIKRNEGKCGRAPCVCG